MFARWTRRRLFAWLLRDPSARCRRRTPLRLLARAETALDGRRGVVNALPRVARAPLAGRCAQQHLAAGLEDQKPSAWMVDAAVMCLAAICDVRLVTGDVSSHRCRHTCWRLQYQSRSGTAWLGWWNSGHSQTL